jgi:hypothetical protein
MTEPFWRRQILAGSFFVEKGKRFVGGHETGTTTGMPKRLPGQSLREQKERLLENRVAPLYLGTAFLWILWLWEHYKLQAHQPPTPTLVLCLAIVATGTSSIVFRRLFFRVRNLTRGEHGELTVAESLEQLRTIGYRPIHDIVGKGFNIDHVLVGPAGVFAIETKFRSGSGEISFRNGEGLFIGEREEEGDCLRQARGNAFNVKRMIWEHCGFFQWVTPMVIFVGNWRVWNDWSDTDALVLTLDRLVPYFANQQPRLIRREIDLIASHLERCAKS